VEEGLFVAELVTEPLRAEHRALLPEVESLTVIAESLDSWDPEVTPSRLAEKVAFLRGQLVPHAEAEEAVLYPAVEEAMGSPAAMATMVADHVEIVRRIELLAEMTAETGTGPPGPQACNALRGQLFGLYAIWRLHFDKEEGILLPELDARLSPQEAEALFGRMGAAAHRP